MDNVLYIIVKKESDVEMLPTGVNNMETRCMQNTVMDTTVTRPETIMLFHFFPNGDAHDSPVNTSLTKHI